MTCVCKQSDAMRLGPVDAAVAVAVSASLSTKQDRQNVKRKGTFVQEGKRGRKR